MKQENAQLDLNREIIKCFNSIKANEINNYCQFLEIKPNKIGVSVDNRLNLASFEKEQLKNCIYSVYGNDIKIVALQPMKTIPEPTSISVAQITSNNISTPKWLKIREDVVQHLREEVANHAMQAWFDKLQVKEDKNKVVLTGSDFYIDYIFSKFSLGLENAAKKNKISIELHFASNTIRPIIFRC